MIGDIPPRELSYGFGIVVSANEGDSLIDGDVASPADKPEGPLETILPLVLGRDVGRGS